MDELKRAITSALESVDPIPRERVRQWIRLARGVEADALLYRLTAEAWRRIEPPLESEETCAFIQRYLLSCIRDDPRGDAALTRYQAAGERERWFDHLAEMRETADTLRGIAAAVTDFYLSGDAEVRKAIETGFLEHVLEQASLRPWFAHWAHDQRLQKAWQDALA